MGLKKLECAYKNICHILHNIATDRSFNSAYLNLDFQPLGSLLALLLDCILSGLAQCITKIWLSHIQLRFRCAHSAKSGKKLDRVNLLNISTHSDSFEPSNTILKMQLDTTVSCIDSRIYSHIVVCVFIILMFLKKMLCLVNLARRRQVLSFFFFRMDDLADSCRALADNWTQM